MLVPLLVVLSISIFTGNAFEFSEDDFFEIKVDRDHPEKLYKEFEEFKIKYNKKYKNEAENRMRMQNFVKTHNTVQELNKKSEEKGHTTQFGINQFADLSNAEFEKRLSPFIQNSTISKSNHHGRLPNFKKRSKRQAGAPEVAIPKNFSLINVKAHGRYVVGAVKDQGTCACCWGFAIAAAVETVYAQHIGPFKALSEQELCDCATNGTLGCSGGSLNWGADYVMGEGLSWENQYEFEESRATETGMCMASKMKRMFPAGRLNFDGVLAWKADEDFQAVLLEWKVPIAVFFATGKGFRSYESGVLAEDDCDMDPHSKYWHAGAIIGYGENLDLFGRTQRYWILKNSWGSKFGENGYLKIIRGRNFCGIESGALVMNVEEIFHKHNHDGSF